MQFNENKSLFSIIIQHQIQHSLIVPISFTKGREQKIFWILTNVSSAYFAYFAVVPPNGIKKPSKGTARYFYLKRMP